jgi:hypothetical protein
MGITESVGYPIGLVSNSKLDLNFTNAAETCTGCIKTFSIPLT